MKLDDYCEWTVLVFREAGKAVRLIGCREDEVYEVDGVEIPVDGNVFIRPIRYSVRILRGKVDPMALLLIDLDWRCLPVEVVSNFHMGPAV